MKSRMQQDGSKYFAPPLSPSRTPPPLLPPTLGVGRKGQNTTFSEHGHIAYQIKWKHECSNILTQTFDPWGGVKGQTIFFFESSHVAYQIRRKWSIEQNASTYSVLTHTLAPGVGSKVKKNSLKEVMLQIKLKGMEHRAPCKHIFCPYTHPQPAGSVKR